MHAQLHAQMHLELRLKAPGHTSEGVLGSRRRRQGQGQGWRREEEGGACASWRRKEGPRQEGLTECLEGYQV